MTDTATAPQHVTRPTYLVGVAAAMGVSAASAAWQLAIRHGMTTSFGVLDLAVLRYVIPGLLFLPAWIRAGGLKPASVTWRTVALMVAGGGAPFGLLVSLGAKTATAAHMAVLVGGAIPVWSAAVSWIVHGSRPGVWQWVGLSAILAGLALLTNDRGSMAFEFGDAAFLVAALGWAVQLMAFRTSGLRPIAAIALMNGWSALLLLPVLAFRWDFHSFSRAAPDALAWQALVQAGVGGFIGPALFLLAVKALGPYRASLSAALPPLFAAAGGYFFLGETLPAIAIPAILMVSLGMVVAGTGAIANR